MSSYRRSKRMREENLRQICLLHFAFSQLITAYEIAQKVFEEAKNEDLEEEERKGLEKDKFMLSFLVKEMGLKLSLYRDYAEVAAKVFTKIVKGLKTANVSNLEMFAVTMIDYFEMPGKKVITFSKPFKEFVYEIDLFAFDEVGGKHIEAASKLSGQIAKLFMHGDYLEFKVAA